MTGGVKNNIDNVTPLGATSGSEAAKPAAPKPEIAGERILISWHSPSYVHYERGFWWYFALIIFVLAVIGYFVWTRDWFPIGAIVLATGALVWHLVANKPKDIDYALTSSGIHVGKKFYSYAEIHSFWIVAKPTVRNLYFVFNRKYLPLMTVGIEGVDPAKLRSVLGRRLPEQPARDEAVLDRLLRFLKV